MRASRITGLSGRPPSSSSLLRALVVSLQAVLALRLGTPTTGVENLKLLPCPPGTTGEGVALATDIQVHRCWQFPPKQVAGELELRPSMDSHYTHIARLLGSALS